MLEKTVLGFAALASAAPLQEATTPAASPVQYATNCAAPGDPTDRLVCATPDLLALDRQMAALVAQVGPLDRKLIEPQAGWLKRRNQCAIEKQPSACVDAAYRERITVLRTLSAPPAPADGLSCRFPDAGWMQVEIGPELAIVRDGTGKVQGIALHREKRSKWHPYLRILDSSKQLRFVLGNYTSYCERS